MSVLRTIDPTIPVPRETVDEVIERVLRLELESGELTEAPETQGTGSMIVRPFTRVIVHARGCAAEKIVRKAQENNLERRPRAVRCRHGFACC